MSAQGHPLVIQCSGVSKRYRLGQAGGTSLGEDLGAWFAKLRGKPDPRIPIGKEVDSQRIGSEFWALNDISFDVQQGETLGIIGRNGAGKSTLLKLLSRITLPTDGEIRMKGRMSSLLEVGTGFNPELTGRENIFINGAILGMRKAEISRKLDDIIAFSGIEHHIDSPVKRYSSGMKVRLGFSVAAHLDPEILVIDEVLAVGDADFQRKCLGKMKDVAQGGRTILFVSHNMVAVRSLCTRVIWLEAGKVRMDGPTDEVVGAYLRSYAELRSERTWAAHEAPGHELVRVERLALEYDNATEPLTWSDPFRIAIDFDNRGIEDGDLNFVLWFFNNEDVVVFTSGWREQAKRPLELKPGRSTIQCHIPARFLNTGEYRVVLHGFRKGSLLFSIHDGIAFEVHDAKRDAAWFGKHKGIVRPLLNWTEVPADPTTSSGPTP